MLLRAEKNLLFFVLIYLVACTDIPAIPFQSESTNAPHPKLPSPSIQVTEQPSPSSLPQTATPTVPSLPSVKPSISPTTSPFPTPELQSALPISHLRMFDANKGWTLHENSSPLQADGILMTSSGRLSWKNVSPVLPKGYYQGPAVSFVDEQHGIAVYIYYKEFSPTPTDVRTWRTADGGRTWQAAGVLKVPTSMFAANQVLLDTPQHGWFYLNGDASRAVSPIMLFETQDGGEHWELVYNTDNSHAAFYDELWGQSTSFSDPHLTFYTPTKGYFASGGLFATQDGGHTWHRQVLPPPADIPDLEDQIQHLKLTDSLSTPRFSSAVDGALVRRVYLRDQVEQARGYTMLPEREYLYFTQDGGKTWTPLPSPAKIGTVFFLDAQQGWYVGKSVAAPGSLPQIYQTQDGGQHWSLLDSKSAPPLGSEMQFVDDQNGFANSLLGTYYRVFDPRSGSEPQLYITKDGGITWDKAEIRIP
jgi:hypothetical protein